MEELDTMANMMILPILKSAAIIFAKRELLLPNSARATKEPIANAKEYLDEALSIAMYAMRAGIHSTLGCSPGSLTFTRDMFLRACPQAAFFCTFIPLLGYEVAYIGCTVRYFSPPANS